MRRLLIATHGELAKGLKQMMEFVLGPNDRVEALCAYTTPEFDMELEARAFADGLQQEDELIVLTDVMGGSVANAFSEYVSHRGIYVLSGVNAPMLLAVAPMLDSDMPVRELIGRGIESAREGCVFLNDLLSRSTEESEEDFT